jgi:outer membrane biosynthesis protein TonB
MRARFWRNVTLIAGAHAILLVALLRWAGETKAASAPEITWLSGGGEAESAESKETSGPALSSTTPEPAESAPVTESEIVLPDRTPAVTPTPHATPEKKTARITPAPKSSPKKTPKSSATPAKKETEAKSKKKAAPSKTATVAAVAGRGRAKKSTGGSGDGTSGTGSGKGDAATANYYGSMLHDRFYRAWQQPQTVVASGVKLSAIAHIRIEKDGRVSSFKIVKASGNVLVDESIQSAGGKVAQVDALPAGMGDGGHYDVNINFALNSE